MSDQALRNRKVEYAPLAYEMLFYFSLEMSFEYSENGMTRAFGSFLGRKEQR